MQIEMLLRRCRPSLDHAFRHELENEDGDGESEYEECLKHDYFVK